MITVSKTLFVLFFAMVFNSTYGQPDPYSMAEKIKMEATLEPLGTKEEYYLVISFTKTTDELVDTFIWNDRQCFWHKKSLLSSALKNDSLKNQELLLYYLKKLTMSQLIIENDQGDMETISYNRQNPKTQLYDTRIVVMSQPLPQVPINNILSFETSDVIIFKYKIELAHLLLNKTDIKVRLHYLFKPYERNDFFPFILTSSWINIPRS